MAPGRIYLASRLGMPLVPVGLGYDRPWRVRRVVGPVRRARALTAEREPFSAPASATRRPVRRDRHDGYCRETNDSQPADGSGRTVGRIRRPDGPPAPCAAKASRSTAATRLDSLSRVQPEWVEAVSQSTLGWAYQTSRKLITTPLMNSGCTASVTVRDSYLPCLSTNCSSVCSHGSTIQYSGTPHRS